MEWTTWTLLSRRLSKNPNFYNLQGRSKRHLSDHVSELIETALKELSETKCVALGAEAAIARGWVDEAGRVSLPAGSGLQEDDIEDLVEPLNLGLVAAYYGIRHTTMEVMHVALSARTRLKGMLEVLCASFECKAACPLRRGEEVRLRRAAAHLELSMPKEAEYGDPATKANILLQMHFSRQRVSPEQEQDTRQLLRAALPVLHAMVDVVASSGWTRPALACMDLCQMVVQGMWVQRDSPLLQVPHFTEEHV